MTLGYKDISIFYSVEGTGEIIVFLHGFLENSSMWGHLSNFFKANYRCIVIDLLGHGKTGNLGSKHSMEMMAETVNAVLAHLNIDKAVFIGHSMGGYVALAFSEMYPNKITKLCLMNSTALADDDERKNLRDRSIKVIKSDKRIFISMAISNLFASDNLLIYNEEINKLKEEAYRISLNGIIAAIQGMKLRPSRIDVLKNLSNRVLVILGRQDSILDVEEQQAYLNGINCELKILEGGHMSQIENKYEIPYIIKRFIE